MLELFDCEIIAFVNKKIHTPHLVIGMVYLALIVSRVIFNDTLDGATSPIVYALFFAVPVLIAIFLVVELINKKSKKDKALSFIKWLTILIAMFIGFQVLIDVLPGVGQTIE